MYISFSGIDSSGKSTQISLLEQFFVGKKIKYIKVWGKVRGTPGILFIKNVFRKDKKLDIKNKEKYREGIYKNSAKKKLLLYLSLIDYLLYYSIYCRLVALKYNVVIFDRYVWDSFVEVSCEFGLYNLEKKWLWKLLVWSIPRPSLSFVFTISPEVSLQRDIEKSDPTIENIEIKKQKIGVYLGLIEKNKWTHHICGEGDIIQIHDQIKVIVIDKYNKTYKRMQIPLC